MKRCGINQLTPDLRSKQVISFSVCSPRPLTNHPIEKLTAYFSLYTTRPASVTCSNQLIFSRSGRISKGMKHVEYFFKITASAFKHSTVKTLCRVQNVKAAS